MPPSFLKFDKNYLNDLTTRAESGVIKKSSSCMSGKYHVALHPAQLNNFKESLEWEVGRNVGKYDKIFKGILLGFENLKLLSKLGTIGPDNCFIHLDIEASFFVFEPKIGMILTGIVTRTTKNHVGCLVYNVFNISIPKPVDQENWIGNNISLQTEVEFKIIYVDLFGRLPHIRGELKSILSTAKITPNKLKKKEKFKSLSQQTTEEDSKQKSSHHIKFDEEEPMNIEEMEYEIAPEKPKKKHRKKMKSEGDLTNTESTMEISAITVEQQPREKKKSKKRTKSENLDVSLDSLDLNSLFSNSQNFEKS